MSDEYAASPLEKLIPSRLSRWLAGALALSLANVAYRAWDCVFPLLQGKTTEIQQAWQMAGALLSALVLAFAMLLDLLFIFREKKHSRIYHHVSATPIFLAINYAVTILFAIFMFILGFYAAHP